MLQKVRALAGISSRQIATFHALSVRDAEALRRDGEPVFDVRNLDAQAVEVLFGDGVWMLADLTDLTNGDAA